MSQNGTSPQPDPRLAPLHVTDKYYFVAVEFLEIVQQGSSIITSASSATPQTTATRKVENHLLNIHPIAFSFQNQGRYPYFAVIYDRMITKKEYEAGMLVIETSRKLMEQAATESVKEDEVLESNILDASGRFGNKEMEK